MSRKAELLIVDDEETFRVILGRELEARGHSVATAGTGEAALERIRCESFEVVLLDIKLPGMDGLAVLEALRELAPLTQVVVLTGHGALDTAIRAMKLGAYDFLTKPFQFDELEAVLQKAREKRALQQENVALKQELARHERFSEFVGRSAPLREVLDLIARVAATDSTVLVTGESGVGKELAARAIHRTSRRSSQPIVVVDCSALHEELLQSELFGHEKGAFTGAHALKRGLLEVADGGSIFLDEIGEFSLPLQAKLLRVLETGTFRRVGGLRDIVVDVRVITATNRNLPQMVEQGQFREDLFYRINVFSIVLPPLRERRQDVPLLAKYLAQRLAGGRDIEFTKEAIDLLMNYHWPGNVRELQNVIERAIILSDGPYIEAKHLPVNLRATPPLPEPTVEAGYPTLEEVERRYIAKLLRELDGHRTRVAQALGISERNLYRKLREYRLG